ncbi:MAG: hypothetical protein AMJ95_01150 [Omnitrophica WOR_2 bacterium SM23_72]|nr:MAG: hypothetical protein AMJ95_01150 [Omnitrophica WOR_2 bacterium SM23_72]
MEKTLNLNETQWFVNPWVDIIFLAGFPIVLIVPFICYLYLKNPHLAYYGYLVSNFPHVLSGLAIIYLSSQEYKKKPLLFLGMPLFFFIATAVLFTLGHSFIIGTTRFYWGQWHIVIQFLYILQLYKLRNHEHLRIDKIIDTLAIIAGPSHIVFRNLYGMQLRFGIKSAFGISMHRQLLIFPIILTQLIVAVFLLRQAYLFIRWKKISPFKIILVAMAIFDYYFPLTFFPSLGIRNFGLMNQGIIIFHNLQYTVWVWFCLRQRFREGTVKEAKALSYLSQPHRVALYFFVLFFISIAFNFIVSKVVGFRYHYRIIIPALAYIHFFLDGRFWNVSKFNSIVNV